MTTPMTTIWVAEILMITGIQEAAAAEVGEEAAVPATGIVREDGAVCHDLTFTKERPEREGWP